MAQVTTSSVSGKVEAEGDPVIGAYVVALHTPSGTKYGAVTNNKGRYSIQGMRVGGPYTITISYVGYRDFVRTDITLALGEPTEVNARLVEMNNVLDEVAVTGIATHGGNGASSSFDLQQIQNAPTVNRAIYDIAKLSPLVMDNKFGGISIAGANNRYNSFQIDGMVSNDVFGLEGDGTNGGRAYGFSVPMDAVEQLQIAVSPFDVRQSGFTGGAINAITKSGTNKYTGTAYTYYTDENMYGRYSQQYRERQPLTDETTKTFGGTIGGPIVKDKLFFFANLEYKKNEYPTSYAAGGADYFMTSEVAKAISDRYAEITGIRETYNRKNIEKKALALLGRVDWNISTRNKLSLRYQLNDSYSDKWSLGAHSFNFDNSSYRMVNKTHTFSLEWNSHFRDNLYNELRAGATLVRDDRDVKFQGPTIYITNAGLYDLATGMEYTTDPVTGYKYGTNTINIGTEYSSGVNTLKQDIFTLEDNLSWYLGNHSITFGTHNEFYNMRNVFVQYANGEYAYNAGLTSFFNDTPSTYYYRYSDASITGTTRWLTPFKAGQFGVYVQDKWEPTTAFQLTFGVRADLPVYFNSPSTNSEFNASSYAKIYGDEIGKTPKSNVMISPRVGFRWFLDEAHHSLLRGGVGIFNGRAPFVWIENAWANTGVEMKGTTINSGDIPTFMQFGGKDPMEAANSAKGTASKPDINLVDRNFKFPQAFRANLAWEYTTKDNFKITLEGMYSRTFNNIWYENLALVDNGEKVYAVSADFPRSATTYYSRDLGSYNSIIRMKNTNRGHSYSLSAKLEKKFRFGLDLMASYAFGHSYSVNDGTSSTATSNWGYYYCVDPNQNTVSYSMYDQPHKITAQIGYN
ncbi:MAG: TonB-dependent receptor, partial [Bacteroidaceae bacterium]|nr:TonB-dependent receptor [Bacteroidaceae bacterium]